MIETDAPREPVRTSRGKVFRTVALVTFAVIAGVSLVIAALVITLATSSQWEKTVLVGEETGSRITVIALVVGVASTAVVIAMFMRGGWRLLWMIPAQIVAVGLFFLGAFVLWFTSGNTVTEIRYQGCSTGYIIEEESRFFLGAGTIYRQEGLLLTEVATTTIDDGYQPFRDNGYVIRQDGDVLDVWYWRGDGPAGIVSTDDAPPLALPLITDSAAASCTPAY